MGLSNQEYKRYLNVHLPLLYYCFCKKYKFTNELSFEQFLKKTMDAKFEARNFLIGNISLLDEYLKDNEQIAGADKEILLGFDNKLSGRFVILKHLKNHSIFMEVKSERFYAVHALSDPFQDMIDSLPVLVEATILPFESKIIYDGFLNKEIYIGKNIKQNMLNQYKEAKANKLIVTTIRN
jgi:hypothetical protein